VQPPGDVTQPVGSAVALVYEAAPGRTFSFWPAIGAWERAGGAVLTAIYGDGFDEVIKVSESQAVTILKRLAPGARKAGAALRTQKGL